MEEFVILASRFRVPLAKEGIPFILIAAGPVAGLLAASAQDPALWWLELIFVPILLFVINFFRDPERRIPEDEDAIVSPADGRVIKAERTRDDRFLNADAIKISIFMNVFNVHVNRAPARGMVSKVAYNPGKFFNASFDKASMENEQNAVIMDVAGGGRIAFNQIAGLIARRIVCYVKPGGALEKGERFGMIRFGSRVDVFVPVGCVLAVKVGDKVSAGSSIIARWTSGGGRAGKGKRRGRQ
ncbi:MAG: phosphatidylserine decarboxylase family protein [Deltaproteobacteria bacterium]|nr:phosphatidylserine decarboxylase family protein [Deltaproteobacteria bacterium]